LPVVPLRGRKAEEEYHRTHLVALEKSTEEIDILIKNIIEICNA
jgi:hypothetical protein